MGARNLESSAGEIMHDSSLDHVVVSNVIGYCIEHAHSPSTVHNVIVSSADLRFFSPKEHVVQSSELARDKTRQTGHSPKD